MKIIGLLPVMNEAWVLRQALACLSGFCDVVIVSDEHSDDDSREICRAFPNVVLLEQAEGRISTRARWDLLDAARNYDGCNLLWYTDADELVSPRLATEFFAAQRDQLKPGTVVECLFLHLWDGVDRYRQDGPYGPYFKELALVDDRRMDFDRSREKSIHEPRVPLEGASGSIRAEELPVLHLQWLLPERMQFRQAWYRCREWLDGGKAAAVINQMYSQTLPGQSVRTAAVPGNWVEDLTFPDLAVDREPTWNERDVRRWFDQHTPEFFEPLEIWHLASLRSEFERRVGRAPRPDRSYLPSWTTRARRFGRRVAGAARRRLPI